MFTTQNFITCVTDGLKSRGFGKKRIGEITDDYKQRVDALIADGMTVADAGVHAMRETFDNISRVSQERVKRNAKAMSIQAEVIDRVTQGENARVSAFLMDGKQASRGTAIARAAVSMLENDPRFSGLSYAGTREAVRGQLYALFGSALDAVSKGAFGRQLGKAHLPNIAREVFGQSTGDAKAKAVADAWLQIADLTVDLFNAAGGSMNRLQRFMPQSQNAVRLIKAGERKWVKTHLDAVDWDRTRWPNGKVIPPEQREEVLKRVYRTISTDGASDIDVSKLVGTGSSLGNKIDTHRFLHYKDADAWLRVHKEFGDGNVFEVMVRHIEEMSHRVAAVETFGPNPDIASANIRAIVRNAASKHGGREVAEADAIMKNKFDPMFEQVMRENPMDPHSAYGGLVTGTSNIITSALLGSASLLAIPGDFMQTAAVRALNGMGMFNGISTYLKALVTDPIKSGFGGKDFMRDIATQSGFIYDEVVMATYAQSRFTGVATVGPAATRMVSEATMRLSLLSGHTRAARWAVQHEFLGLMHRYKGTVMADLPFARVLERYGITPDEWDAFRNGVQTWQPKNGVQFLRPIDVLKTDVPNRQRLYYKFQSMVHDESRSMVPEATLEATNTLRQSTRPDTLAGSLLYSFALYKNFPVSFWMIYGRLGATSQHALGPLGFYAGLGAGMVLVGALGTQMREVSKGRDPLPMDTPQFWGKALLSGGAMSIWGDFLFTGVNEYGRGPEQLAAGPLLGFAGDTTDLLLGDVFQFAESLGSLSDGRFESTTASKAVQWAKRYTPGTSIWWARAALERQVFDRLEELADPRAYQKRRNRVRKQRREFGNEYFWAPGDRTPERAPQLGGG